MAMEQRAHDLRAHDLRAHDLRAHDLLQKGKESLQRHHLSEAERLFRAALRCLPSDTSNNTTQAYEAYHGLAQLYSKKGRYCRNDEKEWHRYYLQSITMFRQAIQLAPSEEHASRVREELLPVQEVYCHCLQTRLFPPPPVSRYRVAAARCEQPKCIPKMNTQWLEELKTHMQTQLVASTEENGRESVSSEESVPEEQLHPQREEDESNKRKVDFNRVRKTIMRMVKQISCDMRSRYLRKRLSQDTLKQAVSSKMLCMLTPDNENMDVVSLFESYLIEEEPEFEMEPDETETTSKPSSTESESEDNDIATEVKTHVTTPLCSISEAYVVPRTYHHIHSPKRAFCDTNSGFQLNGILRIWKAHSDSLDQPATFAPHKLNFEECSPLTETAKHSFEDMQGQCDDAEALSGVKTDTTLAALLSNIAEKLCADNEFAPADELYTYALGIYQQNEARLPAYEAKAIAHLLRSMGVLHCRKGDMTGGAHLLEKSVEMYHKFHGKEEHLDIISVWYELGRGFMYEECHDASLLDYVMKTVKSRVDLRKDAADEVDGTVDYDSDDDDSEAGSGDSYLLNVHEAKGCFNHALRMLHNLRRNKHEIHNAMYVEVLSKLADCCVILGDYEKATLCYEEALILFQNIIGSSLLLLNAHVLTMLGVTNFLLGNYPKAVSMLETAHILQQHMNETEVTFDKAFTLTMLGITNHAAEHHYKCVAWCMKAHEMYAVLFPDLSKLTTLKCWFIIQNVYMLGYAYSFLNLKERALQYLELSHGMVLSALQDEVSHAAQVVQVVHILKLIADVYVAMDQSEKALEHYEKAHEYSLKLGEEQRSNSLHNQLLNCMAGLHITSKNYNTAAQCLEQALDYQENLQDTIKGDMFDMLHSLGLTYTFSGDIDKAIDCYKEAIEAYQEMHGGSPGPEIAGILGRLATLYHVKMCLEENESDERDLCQLADQYYQQACYLDPISPVVVQFANFQYQQAQTPEALLTMLRFLQRSTIPSGTDVVYNGPEQAVLPSHLQFDVDDIDEVVLNAKVFGHFLAILCYKELNLVKDAEDSVVEMYRLVYESPVAINFSMLGYALMEIDLFEEAAEEFSIASRLEPETTNSLVNVWLCLVTVAYQMLSRAVCILLENVSRPFVVAQIETCSQSGVSQVIDYARSTEYEYPSKTEHEDTRRTKQEYSRNMESENAGSTEPAYTRQTEPPGYARNTEPMSYVRNKEPEYARNTEPEYARNTEPEYARNMEPENAGSTEPAYTRKTEPVYSRNTEPISCVRNKEPEYARNTQLVYVRNTEPARKTEPEYARNEQPVYARNEQPVYSPKPVIPSPKPPTTSNGSRSESSISSSENTVDYDQNYNSTRAAHHDNRLNASEIYEHVVKQNIKQHRNRNQQEPLEVSASRSAFCPPAVAMDISPVAMRDNTEAWQEEGEDENTSGNAAVLDDLLKHSQDIEAELEDCLRHIDAVQDTAQSATWRPSEATSPVFTGWRASTSSRTQEILLSIQNNNLASKYKALTEGSEKMQDDVSEPAEDNDEEQWQVWEEEEVIETPPELLAAILQSQKHAA